MPGFFGEHIAAVTSGGWGAFVREFGKPAGEKARASSSSMPTYLEGASETVGRVTSAVERRLQRIKRWRRRSKPTSPRCWRL